ncbi:hypothetical protein D6783_01050 [Candidatus Woesearchaeota archaeon]|nr:MAG: hypothetical protein D6783_01050 [Candidatus Woesearchaeota archaeon]
MKAQRVLNLESFLSGNTIYSLASTIEIADYYATEHFYIASPHYLLLVAEVRRHAPPSSKTPLPETKIQTQHKKNSRGGLEERTSHNPYSAHRPRVTLVDENTICDFLARPCIDTREGGHLIYLYTMLQEKYLPRIPWALTNKLYAFAREDMRQLTACDFACETCSNQQPSPTTPSENNAHQKR